MRRLFAGLTLLIFVLAGFSSISMAAESVVFSNAKSGVNLVSEDDYGVVLKMEIGQIELHSIATKAGDFTLMNIPGFTRSYNIGEPNLPMANRLLSIPFGSDLKVQIMNTAYEDISLSDLGITDPIIPAQPPLSKSDDPASVPFEYNADAYSQDDWYALPMASSEVLGTMRAVHLGRVSLSPVQYNPATNTIRVYTELEVRVEYLHPDFALTQEMREKYHSPVFDVAYSKVINYKSPTAEPGLKADLVRYPIKYVIVSDPAFETMLQPFIEWKKKKGFMVVEAYTDDIGSSNSAITTYLENLYNNASPPEDPAPSFVLIVGDDDQIPAHPGTASSHISDLYFCEYSTPGDVYPEVYYGRFSAQDSAQLQPQIDKTLEYEQYLFPDPNFLGEVTMIAGVDAGHAPTHGNGQINYGTDNYFNAAHGIYSNTWLYPASDDPGAASAIIQTVQDGVGFINYTAHCGHSGHSDPSFTTSDVAGLTNDHMWPLGIGNCCLANTFGDDYSTPCMGEAWLQKDGGGGIGYIGGSNSTYWDEDYWWGVGNGPVLSNPTYEQTGIGVYDGIFHDHGEPDSLHYVTNSAIMFAGNMAVTEAGSSRITYYWEIYHLMGDPSVMTYMGVPSENNVTHAATALITDNTFYVEADPGSYVALTRDGVLYGAAYVDQTGSVTIDIDPFTIPGEADIVVTCQNRQPYIETIMVIAPDGPYVIYDQHDINDMSGNNDGLVDLGESILMGMQVKNVGPDDAYNVSAVLSSIDPFISITDGTESFGDVLGDNGTSYVADAFAFTVAPDVPDGHKITFDMVVDGDERITWNSTFSVTAHAPAVEFVSVDINDNIGNGNGILDPGETAELVVTVQNDGSATAANLMGTLSEMDPYLTITDASGYFGDLAGYSTQGDNTGDVFIVEADSTCPTGYAATLYLDLSADGGYTKNTDFNITVGDRVILFGDDFSTDQGWTGLGGDGEWTIGSPAGGGGDPSQDHSPSADNQVLGNDLTSTGTYNNSLSTTFWVVSPVIDCEDYTGVQMRYFHWLGVESSSYDHAYFDVYDGTDWVRLYENGSTLQESSWNEEFYDLSTYADENPDFQLRWGIGPTDGSVQKSGWNIDDIEIKGYYNGSEYKVDLKPEIQAKYGPAGDSATYMIMVRNRGAYFDQFDLQGLGNWDVVFFTETGDEPITTTPSVGSLDSVMIKAKVIIPAGTELHVTEPSTILATSQGNAMAQDTCYLYTSSAGEPANIPWVDNYVDSDLDMLNYLYNAGATVSDECANPPSPPYALNLDGEIDTLITEMIDLSGHTDVILSYYWQCGGNGNLPQDGENLKVSYRNSLGDWVCVLEHEADTAMQTFKYYSFPLLADAMHSSFQLMFTSNGSADGLDDWFIDNVRLDQPPSIDIDPSLLSQTLLIGEEADMEMVIDNTGNGDLIYNIGLNYHIQFGGKFGQMQTSGLVRQPNYEYPDEFYLNSDDKDNPPAIEGLYGDFKAGGPDNFGYFWIDSDEAGGPAFDWIDISTTGTMVMDTPVDDGYYGPFEIGFEFPFYGGTYDSIYIGSNGIVGFDEASMSSRSRQPIPSSMLPNNIIAWMWDDLNPADADNPGAQIFMEGDAEKLVIQFVDYPEYRADPGDVINAEVILFANGSIKFQYLDIASGFDISNSAIGIENKFGDDGLEVCYATPYVHNGLAVQFEKPYEWLQLDKLSGVVAPGASDTVNCHFSTVEDLGEDTYTADVVVISNDPVDDTMMVIAQLETMMEEPYTCGDANNDGSVDVSDAVVVVNYAFGGGTPPDPLAAGDVNCDASVDVSDAVSIINYSFAGGNAPCDTDGDGNPDC